MVTKTSTRDYLKLLAASAGYAASASLAVAQEDEASKRASQLGPPPEHERRMRWWHEAKFGMFIHWGLYSVIGRHEWAIVSTTASAGDQIVDDGFGRFPVVVSFVISPTVVQRHTSFPSTPLVRRTNLDTAGIS